MNAHSGHVKSKKRVERRRSCLLSENENRHRGCKAVAMAKSGCGATRARLPGTAGVLRSFRDQKVSKIGFAGLQSASIPNMDLRVYADLIW